MPDETSSHSEDLMRMEALKDSDNSSERVNSEGLQVNGKEGVERHFKLEVSLPDDLHGLLGRWRQDDEEERELKDMTQSSLINSYVSKGALRQMEVLEAALKRERGKRLLLAKKISREQKKRLNIKREYVLTEIETIKLCAQVKKMTSQVFGESECDETKYRRKPSKIACKIAFMKKKKFDQETDLKVKVLQDELNRYEVQLRKHSKYKMKKHPFQADVDLNVTVELCEGLCSEVDEVLSGEVTSRDLYEGRERESAIEKEKIELEEEMVDLKEHKYRLLQEAQINIDLASKLKKKSGKMDELEEYFSIFEMQTN